MLKAKPIDQQLELTSFAGEPITEVDTDKVIDEVAGSWAFGDGIGHTTVKVGSLFVFPPYGLYLLGNSVLEVVGYERIEITDVLPEEQESQWDQVYQAIISGPGRVVAAVSGSEYRSQQEAARRIRRLLHPEQAAAQDLHLYLNEG
jgi:hypothetical protein